MEGPGGLPSRKRHNTLPLVGTRIDKLHVGRRRRSDKPTVSARWSAAVSRRPVRSAVIGGVLFLALQPIGLRIWNAAIAHAGSVRSCPR